MPRFEVKQSTELKLTSYAGPYRSVLPGGASGCRDQGVGLVVRELGLLVEQTLRNWVKAAERGQLHPTGAKVVTQMLMELSRLRSENARLRITAAMPWYVDWVLAG